jgi:hypothetical protein
VIVTGWWFSPDSSSNKTDGEIEPFLKYFLCCSYLPWFVKKTFSGHDHELFEMLFVFKY